MKIELSPWTVVETSARLPRKRRRTHHKDENSTSTNGEAQRGKQQQLQQQPPSHLDPDAVVSVSAALIGDSSSASARSKSLSSWDPVISLTLAHRILLLGLVSRDDGLAMEEDRHGQYVTRPSPSASFLPPSPAAATTSGSSTPLILPSIPCLCESNGRRLYAFLEGNHRLVSWTSDQAVEEGVGASLPSPALSLATTTAAAAGGHHDNNLVFGSCADGSLFLGRLSTNDGRLEIDCLNPGIPSTARHVATFADASLAKSKRTQKRKTVHIFQVYAEGTRLLIYRHTPVAATSSVASRPCTSKCLSCSLVTAAAVAASVSELQLVGRCRDEMVLSYIGGDNFFLCRVSLSQARVTGTIPLPCHPARDGAPPRPHVGLVGSLAVLVDLCSQASPASNNSSGSISLVDVHRGGLVAMQPLDFEFDRVLSLLTDGSTRVALVVARNDEEVCAGLTTVRVASQRGCALPLRPITLAEGLSARCGLSHPFRQELAGLASTASESNLSRAISLLTDAKHSIERSTAKSRRKDYLSGVYSQAVLILTHGETRPERRPIDAESANKNPQEPSEQQNGLNGKKRKSPSKPSALPPSELINGTHPPALHAVSNTEPRLLPTAFVEPASCVTVEILLIPKLSEGTRNEARVMLRRFVRTGKIPARRVLTRLHEVLRALERPSNSDKAAYSPVDLIFDLFRCCKDLSEHQAVASVRYLVCLASIRDIVSHLRRNKKQLRLDKSLVSTLDDWDRLEISPSRSDEEQLLCSSVSASAKIALAATSVLIPVVAMYSKFNEVLLRNAVRTLLSRGEVGLMCRLLSDSLTSGAINTPIGRKAVMQWLAVATEQLHRTRGASDCSTADVAYARRTVHAQARMSESVLAIQNLVAASVDSAKRSLIAAKASMDSRKENTMTPSYQIERLIL